MVNFELKIAVDNMERAAEALEAQAVWIRTVLRCGVGTGWQGAVWVPGPDGKPGTGRVVGEWSAK